MTVRSRALGSNKVSENCAWNKVAQNEQPKKHDPFDHACPDAVLGVELVIDPRARCADGASHLGQSLQRIVAANRRCERRFTLGLTPPWNGSFPPFVVLSVGDKSSDGLIQGQPPRTLIMLLCGAFLVLQRESVLGRTGSLNIGHLVLAQDGKTLRARQRLADGRSVWVLHCSVVFKLQVHTLVPVADNNNVVQPCWTAGYFVYLSSCFMVSSRQYLM